MTSFSEVAPRLLTVKEAAAATRVSPASIYRAIRTGELQAAIICGVRRIPVECLTAFIRASLTPSPMTGANLPTTGSN